MKKTFLTCALFVASLLGAGASDGDGVLTFLGLQNYSVSSISPNGKWAAGSLSSDGMSSYAFRWNLETGECKLLTTNYDVSTGNGVANDGTVVGEYRDYTLSPNGAPMTALGYYRDGSWHLLETITGSYDEIATVECITADGQYIGGANYDENGDWRPVIWKDGKIYKVLDGEGTVFDITEDCKYATGWGYKPGGESRYSVIWDVETGEATYLTTKGSIFTQGLNFTSDGKYLFHQGHVEVTEGSSPQFRGNIYDIVNKTQTWLPYLSGSNFTDNLQYRWMDDSRNVYGLETLGGMSYGTVTHADGKVERLDAYLSSMGFNYTDDPRIMRPTMVTAASNDGMTLAVGVIDTAMYERPLIIRFNQNLTNRQPASVEVSQLAGILGARIEWQAPVNNPANLTGYNVYRNGEKINAQPVTATHYIDAGLAEGDVNYAVTAVYGTTESAKLEAQALTVSQPQVSAPRQLYARQKGFNNVALTWTVPSTNLVSKGYYDKDASLIGFGGGNNSFEFAIKYDKDELAAYEGYSISKVSFVPRSAQQSWTLKIYNGSELIYEQPITQALNYGEENIVTLDKPVDLSTVTGDVLCAIAVTVDPLNNTDNVVGMVETGCKPGYSDLVHLASETEFYSLSEQSQLGGYSFDIAFAMNMILSKESDAANIDQVTLYNIIADGRWIGNTKDNSYLVENVADGAHTYQVSALYVDGRQSSNVAASVDVAADLNVLSSVSNVTCWGDTKTVTFGWEAPKDDDRQNITYSGETFGQAISSTEQLKWKYRARSIYPSSRIRGLDGYVVNAVRFYAVSSGALLTIYIYQDGKEVAYQEIDEYTGGMWNTITLDNPIVINENSEYTLDIDCFDIPAGENNGPLAVDDYVQYSGYSNLSSTDDGVSFAQLQSGAQFGEQERGNWMMGMVAVDPAAKPLPVDGYKVRIDNESVTPSLITDNYLQYTFPDDVDTEATHRVAVDVTYTGYGEVRGTATYFNLNDLATGIGSTVTADLRVYPNPATNYVAVEGADVDEISAFSLGGALMGRTTGNRLDVSTYAKGLYILKIKAEGKVQTVKLNVIR